MSSNPYLLLNPGRVHSGAGSLSQLPELATYFKARRLLIVTINRPEVYNALHPRSETPPRDRRPLNTPNLKSP